MHLGSTLQGTKNTVGEGAAEGTRNAMKEGRKNRGKRDKQIKSRGRKRKNPEEAMPMSEERTKETPCHQLLLRTGTGLISGHLEERPAVDDGSPPQSLCALNPRRDTLPGQEAQTSTADSSPGAGGS